jgi:signal transduction histidine kinase/CheY-like chemotaxis protein
LLSLRGQKVFLFAFALLACRRPGPTQSRPLTSADAIQRLSWEEASARPPVQLAGTVTVVDHFTQTMFVQDNSGAVWVTLPIAMRAPTMGATIGLRGTAVAVGPDRAIINPVIDSLQQGKQPEPRPITNLELKAEHRNYTLSRFRVRIKRIMPTIGKEIRFSGEMAGGPVEVSLQTAQALDVGGLVGKEVEVIGVPAPPTQASTTALPLFLAQKLKPLEAPAQNTARRKLLTTIREVKALDSIEVLRSYPVDLHGVVTTCSPGAYMLTMQDATGAIFVWLLHPERYPPQGFRIRVEGHSAGSESLPMVTASKVTIEAPAPMPAAFDLASVKVNDFQLDNSWIHVDGVVREVAPSPIGGYQMVVASARFRTTVMVQSGTATEAARFLPGMPVSFDGTYSAHADRFRRWRYFLVYTPSLSGIRIRQPAPVEGPGPQVEDLPLRNLFRYGSESSPEKPVRIRGIVTLRGTDGSFYISDGDGGVQVVPTPSAGTVKPGMLVEVTGFLPTSPSDLQIEDATWRVVGASSLPVAPVVQAESALDGSYESRWIRLEGRLTHRQRAIEHNILVLETPSALVNVYCTGAADTAWESLRMGSTLMVRGIILPLLDKTSLTGSRTVSMLIGSSGDIQVLKMASWWTPEHLTTTLITVSALLLALFLLASFLARRVWSQSRTIAKRLEMEAALKLEAQAANRAKSHFLASMSHEIRTPMNGVLGLTELAVQTVGQPEQLSYLQSALQSARSLMNILNDILDLAKIEAGKMTVREESFAFSSILQPAVAAAKAQCNAKGLQIVCSVNPDVPDRLIGDEKRLQQILGNLLSNACKFTHDGRIEIEASAEDRLDQRFSLVVHVRDTGIGIAEDQITRVFGDFEQADRNDSRRYEGTGLGLAICLRLTQLLGGQIDVTSTLGQGSDFRVSLPMRLAAAAAAPSAAQLPVGAALPESLFVRPLKILAAEDNRINRLLLGRILEMAGHHAVFAENGVETLQLWQDGEFDLLLMDLQMPGMDGLEATREIRKREGGKRVRTPIIAVTARAMHEDRDIAVQAGMDGYVSKPYSAEDILTAIQRVIRHSNDGASH